MHIISRKKLREFSQAHADSGEPLDDWYITASQATWGNLLEVQTVYPQAEEVSNSTFFNVYLITDISYFDLVYILQNLLT